MAITDASPNPETYYKGTGIAYFMRTGETVYRDLGSVSLVDTTPSVAKTDHFIARGGARRKDKTFVTEQMQVFAVTLEEYTAQNIALALGGSAADPVSLVTTADTASTPALTNIASVVGLVPGRRYWVSGVGIPVGASFVYVAGNAATLDRPATATATGVAVTISCPVSFTVFDESQITGQFLFVSDNDVGARVTIEALNVILTPSGKLELLNSGDTTIGNIPMTMDVFLDPFGHLAQFYWNTGTGAAWAPADGAPGLISFTTTVALTDGDSGYVGAPVAGHISRLDSVLLGGAVTTNNAVVTAKIGAAGSGVAITNGVITIAFSGSAAGDADTASPTAANTVEAGSLIYFTVSGTPGGSRSATVTIEISP